MSIDKSLKLSSSHSRRRNVLTRAEKIEKLTDDGKWDPEKDSVFGLPKVRVSRDARKPRAKKGPEEETEAQQQPGAPE